MECTKAVFVLILCLVSNCTGQKQYAIASISYTQSDRLLTTEKCAIYEGTNTELPRSYTTPGLRAVSVNNENDDCLETKMLESLEGLGMVAFVNENCSAYNTSLVGQNLNASLVVLVADYLRDWINESITVPVLQVSNVTGNKIVMALDNNSTVYLHGYRPPLVVAVDPSLVVLIVMAVATVCLGSVLANMPCAFLRRGLLVPDDGFWKKVEQQSNKKMKKKTFKELTKKEKTKLLLTLCVVLWAMFISLGVVVTAIIFLYIYYYVAVYITIAGFGAFGVIAVYSTLSPFVASIPYINDKLRLPPNRIPILKNRPGPLFFLTFLFSVGIVIWWGVERNSIYGWALHAIVGFSYSTLVYKMIRFVKKPWIIAVIMAVTILIDIFVVFVTRAFTNDGRSALEHYALGAATGSRERLPILFWINNFIYPNHLDNVCNFARGNYILGFGDVLIPGMLVVLALKHDLTARAGKRFKLYFFTISIAYIIGLISAYTVLYYTGVAQPALVYLVPATIGSMILLSLINKECCLFFNPKVKKPDNEEEGNANEGSEAGKNETEEQQNELVESESESNSVEVNEIETGASDTIRLVVNETEQNGTETES